MIFVMAPATQLPKGSTCLDALQKAQATGPSTGFALRIFSRGAAYLLRSPRNARRLMEAVDSLEAGRGQHHVLAE